MNDPKRQDMEALIQAILDAPVTDPTRREMLGAIRRDPGAMSELQRSVSPLAELRRPVASPDLSGRILHAADRRRRFLPRKLRRFVDGGRIATAAGLLLVVAVLATVQRHWPEATELVAQPRPLTDATRAFADDTTASAGLILSETRRVRGSLLAVPHGDEDLGWSQAATPAPLEAWVLSTVGPEGSRLDTVLTYERSAPRERSLRVYIAPSGERAPITPDMLAVPTSQVEPGVGDTLP